MEGRAIARPNAAPERGVQPLAPQPSMEGRAIARPNTGWEQPAYPLIDALQWRAGQLPGQTSSGQTCTPSAPSLQWRAGQLPGQTELGALVPTRSGCLQWRAGQLPGQTAERVETRPRSKLLQWRAGQLPGQTGLLALYGEEAGQYLQWRAGQLPGQTARQGALAGRVEHPSMEGRAIARPNEMRSPRVRAGRWPSMEGRAIARPNISGGEPCEHWTTILQWRAGQLPGQTDRTAYVDGVGHPPSMEGRAIARPNLRAHTALAGRRVPSMEGRAIARPNTRSASTTASARRSLQWRAGQLPGQTGSDSASSRPATRSFNGGPGNCPAKRRLDRRAQASRRPSMEGRAIARPNFSNQPTASCSTPILQWRAGQLPGQTGRQQRRAVDADGPSMEGRAIARPNPAV